MRIEVDLERVEIDESVMACPEHLLQGAHRNRNGQTSSRRPAIRGSRAGQPVGFQNAVHGYDPLEKCRYRLVAERHHYPLEHGYGHEYRSISFLAPVGERRAVRMPPFSRTRLVRVRNCCN